MNVLVLVKLSTQQVLGFFGRNVKSKPAFIFVVFDSGVMDPR